MSKGAPNVRFAEIDRETRNTKVHLVLDLDGGHRCDVATGVSTFDDLLRDMASYAVLDLGVSVEADVAVQDHFVLEDVGAVFGRALRKALDNSDPVVGCGSSHVASADALVLCALDLDGRPHLGWDVAFRRDWIGEMATENVRGFFESVMYGADCSLHVLKLAGANDRHVAEACFRAFGRALHGATRRAERPNGSK
ncbi:MAG: imidazoleglycerol-phosphate dehydratase [Armatimonadetes bacterium]|nr:imidazoleglycerol-phosphate dehydratase [Armatimonadota bacterium]